MAILQKQKQNVDQDQLIASLLSKVNELQAKLEANEKRREAPITCKIGEKGNLCIYGLGKFPVSLYISQFDKLASNWKNVCEFVEKNRGQFATKD